MSSIIDFGPHTVTIYVEETVVDSYGNAVKRPSQTPVVVTGCTVTPLASARGAFPAATIAQGQRLDQTYRFVSRHAPVGWWSRVVWEGRNLTVLGGPLVAVASDGTRHISATLHEET